MLCFSPHPPSPVQVIFDGDGSEAVIALGDLQLLVRRVPGTFVLATPPDATGTEPAIAQVVGVTERGYMVLFKGRTAPIEVHEDATSTLPRLHVGDYCMVPLDGRNQDTCHALIQAVTAEGYSCVLEDTTAAVAVPAWDVKPIVRAVAGETVSAYHAAGMAVLCNGWGLWCLVTSLAPSPHLPPPSRSFPSQTVGERAHCHCSRRLDVHRSVQQR